MPRWSILGDTWGDILSAAMKSFKSLKEWEHVQDGSDSFSSFSYFENQNLLNESGRLKKVSHWDLLFWEKVTSFLTHWGEKKSVIDEIAFFLIPTEDSV